MKLSLLIFLVFITQFVIAQETLVGLRGGISRTRVETDTPFENNDPSSGFLGGITVQRQLENGLYWGIDFLYSQRGFESDLFPGSFDPCLGCLRVAPPEDNQFQYDYISLPVKVGYNWGNRFMIFGDIALVPSRLVNAEITSDGFFVQDIEEVDTFDLGAQIEIGTAIQLFEGWTVFGSLGYLRSLTSITNDRYFPNNQMFHQHLNLSFGVKYLLDRP